MPPPTVREQIPPHTFDLLILRVLERSALAHFFGMAEVIREQPQGILQAREWSRTAENRRAWHYRLTLAGRKQLEKERTRYHRVSAAIARILQPA